MHEREEPNRKIAQAIENHLKGESSLERSTVEPSSVEERIVPLPPVPEAPMVIWPESALAT